MTGRNGNSRLIDAARLWSALEEVNRLGATPAGGAERLAWSSEELAARRWFAERAQAARLEPEWDEAGNVWGWGERRPAVVLGSHLDTVPDGGRFDGALGCVAALEAAGSARALGLPGAERLAVVCFTDEEGVRFGVGMPGSRAVAGALDPEELSSARTADGTRLEEVMAAAGFAAGDAPRAARNLGAVGAYLELHIEQGRRLERAAAAAGIVTAIVGLRHAHVEVTGEANHAGTTVVEDRRDALLPVAALVAEARRVSSAVRGVVATVGEAEVVGGAPNVVPGRARCTLDVRSADPDALEGALREILDAGRLAAADGRCSFDSVETKRFEPAPMDSGVVESLRACAAELGLSPPLLESLAGHDGMNLARAGARCGMVFVRSEDGVSHSPRERSSPEDCALGAELLAGAALRIAGQMP